MNLNKVQTAAYELIQSDARFLYTLVDISKHAPKVKSNYIMMSQPYIGIFADGAEQWCRKVGLDAPNFDETEKTYYTSLRLGHKLFEKSYENYKQLLREKYEESDNYFYSIRGFREKIKGYYNVGADICNGEFCGNTILCAMYTPIKLLGNNNAGIWLKNISVIAGKLADYFRCTKFPPYMYDVNMEVKPKDYHFYKNCPLKTNNEFGFLLFSILCSINFVTQFVETFWVEEIPQKFKFAYLQYYYLCDFIKELNQYNATNFYIDDTLQNRNFRNCLAHYGLGQLLNEDDVITDDVLKGLTNKAFNLDYSLVKECLYRNLNDLGEQIKTAIIL